MSISMNYPQYWEVLSCIKYRTTKELKKQKKCIKTIIINFFLHRKKKEKKRYIDNFVSE